MIGCIAPNHILAAVLFFFIGCGCGCAHGACRDGPRTPTEGDALSTHVRMEVLIIELDVRPDHAVLHFLVSTSSVTPLAFDSWQLAQVLMGIRLQDADGEVWQLRDVRPHGASGGSPPQGALTASCVAGANAHDVVTVQGVLVPLTPDRTYAVLPKLFGMDDACGRIEAFSSEGPVGEVECVVIGRPHGTISVRTSEWQVFED